MAAVQRKRPDSCRVCAAGKQINWNPVEYFSLFISAMKCFDLLNVFPQFFSNFPHRFAIVCMRAGCAREEISDSEICDYKPRVISIPACARNTLRGGRLALETSWVSAEVSVGSFTGRSSDVD